jgi:ankyrin repeat protein
VREGHIGVVKLLVARNANFSLQNEAEVTPIAIAISMKNEALVMLLIDATMAAGTPLVDATTCLAATICADVIRLLVHKHRIDLTHIRDDRGRTVLHHAVVSNSAPTVLNALIEVAGIDVNARDNAGHTCCHTAAAKRNAIALRCFIAAAPFLIVPIRSV